MILPEPLITFDYFEHAFAKNCTACYVLSANVTVITRHQYFFLE
jgi:hypothetical protein